MASVDSIDKEIEEIRRESMFPQNTFDEVTIENLNVKFVDKDNYNKFMNIKTENGFIIPMLQSFGKDLYMILVMCMGVLYILKLLKKRIQIIEQILVFCPEPNMYILFVPMFLTILFKSFNSFSEIKISL